MREVLTRHFGRLLEEKAPLPDAEVAAQMVRMGEETAAALGMRPYYLYRQKYMSGSFENVGWSRDNRDCLYNIYMMEEVHSILSVGAGAVTKLVEYYPANIASTKIIRHFNPKYPYEYLNNDSSSLIDEEIRKFYATH